MTVCVEVQQVSKSFRQHTAGRNQTLRDWLSGFGRHAGSGDRVDALSGISFRIESGEAVGVIGANGAGKSTLLRLVGGVGCPDHGTIRTRGRFGALLELGTGGYDNLSGRDNVIVGSVIAGLTPADAEDRMDDIVAFAELGEYIDNPLRTYSTGMQMRLAFGVIVFSEPQILLVDEVLAVGDLAFQQKCIRKIRELQQQGCCILLATHDLEQVTRLCDRAIWLEHGKQRLYGSPEEVVEVYRRKFSEETIRLTPAEPDGALERDHGDKGLVFGETRLGSQEIEIIGLRPQEPGDANIATLKSGARASFLIDYEAKNDVDGMIVGISISNADGQICIDVNSGKPDAERRIRAGRGVVNVEIEKLALRPGAYEVSVGLYEKNWQYAYDYHWNAYSIDVEPGVLTSRDQVPTCQWRF